MNILEDKKEIKFAEDVKDIIHKLNKIIWKEVFDKKEIKKLLNSGALSQKRVESLNFKALLWARFYDGGLLLKDGTKYPLSLNFVLNRLNEQDAEEYKRFFTSYLTKDLWVSYKLENIFYSIFLTEDYIEKKQYVWTFDFMIYEWKTRGEDYRGYFACKNKWWRTDFVKNIKSWEDYIQINLMDSDNMGDSYKDRRIKKLLESNVDKLNWKEVVYISLQDFMKNCKIL